MKFMVHAALLVAILPFIQGVGSRHNPDKVLEFAKREIDGAKTGEAIDAAYQRVRARALEAASGVDAGTVELKDSFKWAQVFQYAQMPKETLTAIERYLGSSPTEDLTPAQLLAIGAYIQSKQPDKALALIGQTHPASPSEVLQYSVMTAKVAGKSADPVVGIQTLLNAEKYIKLDGAALPKQRADEEFALSTLISTRARLLASSQKPDEAIKAIDSGLATVSPGSNAATHLKALRNQYTIVGQSAPDLTTDRAYGVFSGLDQWKGKVIVVDFFAHWDWSGIAILTDLEKLYVDDHPKGLEIIGSTTYYGYYAQERGLSHEREFALMEGFIKKYNIPWPVQFSDRSNFDTYGVTDVPQVAVIDKSGKVRLLRTAISREPFADFRKEIEKLLTE